MLHKRNQKSIEETVCLKCYLLTPAWRAECVHCGLPVGPRNASRKEPGTDGSSLEQRSSEEAR